MDKSIILMSDYKCIIPLHTICVFCLYRDIEYCGNDLQGHNTLLTERLDDMPQKRSLHDIFNLKSHTLKIVVLVLLFAASTALGVIVPLLEQQLIDDGLIKLDTNVVLRFSVLFLLVISISKGIEFLELSIQNKIQTDVGIKLKQKIFEHAFQLKPSQYQKDGFLKILSDALYDVDNVLEIVENNFLIIGGIAIKTAGAIVALLIISWKLTLVVLCFIPVKILLNSIAKKRVAHQSESLLETHKKYTHWLNNTVLCIPDIKLWNLKKQKEHEGIQYEADIHRLLRKSLLVKQANNSCSQILDHLVTYALYLSGVLMMLSQNLTLGGLMAFISYSSYIVSPLDIILGLRLSISEIQPSIASLRQFFSLERENHDSITHIPDDIKSISAINLSFQIDDNVILKDISFEIFKGEKVAIIGDNGSGKSTLINLLLRMQDFSSGELTLNGNNIRKYDIDEYRSLFSVVSQKVNMFNTTIIENVFINKNEEPEDPEKTVRKYSDMLGPNIISRLYDTTGSEGSFLSGGEKQKIALTRALCHKRKILLLDEAASNLDFASHQKMLDLVLSSTDFDIVFVVTHDHKELSRYDRILRLEKGQLTVIKQDWS